MASFLSNPFPSAPDKVKEKTYDDIVHPVAKEAGKSLETIGMVVNKFMSPLRKWASAGEENTSKLEEKVNNQLASVSTENIAEPPTHVAVPVILANSYTDSDHLRDLYANLLARSMYKPTEKDAHPAFVEIIKQLSPKEAILLKDSPPLLTSMTPVCNVRYQKTNENKGYPFSSDDYHLLHPENIFRRFNTGKSILQHYIITNNTTSTSDIYDISFMLENFARLKLINISYDKHICNARRYKDFYMNTYMKELSLTPQPNEVDFEIAHIAGIITPTSFGKKFYDVCIKDFVNKKQAKDV